MCRIKYGGLKLINFKAKHIWKTDRGIRIIHLLYNKAPVACPCMYTKIYQILSLCQMNDLIN